MQITTTTLGDWTVLHLTGRIDHAGATELGTVTAPLPKDRKLALDFRGVDYVTSPGFRLLLQLEKERRLHHGQLMLGHLSPAVLTTFEITGLATTLVITGDLARTLHPDS